MMAAAGAGAAYHLLVFAAFVMRFFSLLLSDGTAVAAARVDDSNQVESLLTFLLANTFTLWMAQLLSSILS